MHRSQIVSFLLALSFFVGLSSNPRTGFGQDWSSILGSSHTSGKYYFTPRDFLNEGAIAVSEAGMRVIKIWFDDPAKYYMWNTNFPPKFDNYVQMAEHPHFRELFNRPFDVYVLTIFHKIDFKKGCPDPLPAQIEQKYYELAKHLLTAYRGTGKTFIIGHHEGDWHLRGCTKLDRKFDPGREAIQGMIRWYNARQAGTERARREVKKTDVKVYHAAEVNLVKLAMDGRPTVTNDVLPHINPDMVSYSAYDIVIRARNEKDEQEVRREFRKALDYLDSKVKDTEPFGNKNIFISEYGAPEREWGEDAKAAAQVQRVCRTTVEVASQWGCPWIIYWEIYDNECCEPDDSSHVYKGGPNPGARPATRKEHCRGFWLVKVDGSYSTARDYLTGLLQPYLVPTTDFKAALSTEKREIQLTWADTSDEENYRLEKSVNGGEYELLGKPPKDKNIFQDKKVEPGKTYQYRLRSERNGYKSTSWFYSEPCRLSR